MGARNSVRSGNKISSAGEPKTGPICVVFFQILYYLYISRAENGHKNGARIDLHIEPFFELEYELKTSLKSARKCLKILKRKIQLPSKNNAKRHRVLLIMLWRFTLLSGPNQHQSVI